MMKTLLLTLSLTTAVWSQVSVTGPNANMKPGQTAALSVNIAGASNVAAIQGNVTLPAGWPATCAIGTTAATASKQVACVLTPAGQLTFVVYGMNSNNLFDGAMVQVALVIPSTVAPGTNMIGVSGQLGASPAGDAVPLVAGVPFPLSITSAISPCDLNGDGAVNIADVQVMVNRILSGVSTSTIVDLQRVVVAAMGGACRL